MNPGYSRMITCRQKTSRNQSIQIYYNFVFSTKFILFTTFRNLLRHKFSQIVVKNTINAKISALNPLSAWIFTVFRHSLLEDRVLHKEAWVAKLLGTPTSVSRSVKRSNFHVEITQHWHLKG